MPGLVPCVELFKYLPMGSQLSLVIVGCANSYDTCISIASDRVGKLSIRFIVYNALLLQLSHASICVDQSFQKEGGPFVSGLISS